MFAKNSKYLYGFMLLVKKGTKLKYYNAKHSFLFNVEIKTFRV